MTRGKRPYVRKIRGCYECSQRRIHCDRGNPSCAKCIAKGVRCSGLGVRYRFNDDVSWKGGKNKTREPRSSQLNVSCDAKVSTAGENDPSSAPMTQISVEDRTLSCINPCDAVDPWKRYFLLHFANKIAPELVAFDNQRNGWRFLVLPVAYSDSLVMDTVLSAAAFHLSSNTANNLHDPSMIYAKAIQRLRRRQDLETQDILGKQGVLLALLVLLATVMVNGYSDFPTIFNLLESALDAVGGEETLMHGELGLFLVRQIRKYRGYAAPFLSQAKGFARLSITTSCGQDAVDGWDCFKYCSESNPALSHYMSIIYELNKLGCDIYVARVLAGADGPPLTSMVEQFTVTMNALPAGSPGEHILVFATFLAAAESVELEHKKYFTDALLGHYRRNGFANILLALEHLERIWSGSVARDWTRLLPDLQLFIV